MPELEELIKAAAEILGGELTAVEGAWNLEISLGDDRNQIVLIEELECDLKGASGQPLVHVEADIGEVEDDEDALDYYYLLSELPFPCFARPYIDAEENILRCDAAAFRDGLDPGRLAAIIAQVASVADRMEAELYEDEED